MAAEVESIAVELDRLGDPADASVGLEDRSALTAEGQHMRGRKTGRAAAEDGRLDRLALLVWKAAVRLGVQTDAEAIPRSLDSRQFSPPLPRFAPQVSSESECFSTPVRLGNCLHFRIVLGSPRRA
jgi:hypothetical protein